MSKQQEPATDSPDEAAVATAPVNEGKVITRRVLAGLFWLLATLSILVSGVTLWAHQTLLTSDGWGNIVSGIVSDEEVIDGASARIVDQLFEAIGVGDVVANILPGEMDVIGGAITVGLQDRITQGVSDFASGEGFQDAFVNINETAHDAAMKVIRGGDSEALTSDEGAITLNVFPLVEGVLVSLQDAGLIDESREIPDLSDYEAPAETVARLETLLGRDIPDDIGTITLIESESLARVQTAVRNFDVITVVLLLLALACIVLAVWLSARRVRMVLWLAVGAIGAFMLGRGFTRLVLEDISGSLRDGEGRAAVRAVVESAVDSLMWFSFALMVVALIIAGLAIWSERRAAAAGEAATDQPEGIREWLRSRSRLIGYIGIGLIAFVVLWNVGGPDITLLAAAAVGVVLVATALLAGRDGKGDAPEESEEASASTGDG